jgi:hypothetical protein
MRAEGLEWEERDAATRPEWRAELMAYSKNTGMVPTVVIGDEVVTVGWHGHG